jgi:CMP-N-acetylneuraminic acid synthetase
VFTRDVLEGRGNRIGANPLMFEVDPSEAVDIDEERDFALAEQLVAAGAAR